MRILVVEDEPRLLRNLAKALREEGYAVDTAETGEDGLFNAKTYDYDVIVLDIMLPLLDGWALLRDLRKHKRTPVLMLTARDARDDRVRGLDTGADDYLVKPFDLSELLARLRALIRRSAGLARSQIELRDIIIDSRARSVTRAGQPVTLTTRGMQFSNTSRFTEVSWSHAPPFMSIFSMKTPTPFPTLWTCTSSAYARNWGAISSPPGVAKATASRLEPWPFSPNPFVGGCCSGSHFCWPVS